MSFVAKDDRRCGNCAAWDIETQVTLANGAVRRDCRRTSPIVIHTDAAGIPLSIWPTTARTDRCWKWIGLQHALDADLRKREKKAGPLG